MQAYAKGDNEAFSRLYQRYQSKLYGFLFMRLTYRRQEVAAELFQVVWLKIHQAKSRYDSSKKFSSWFFTIAINTVRDFFSASSNRLETVADSEDTSLDGEDSSHGPEALVFRKEKIREISTLMENLSPSRREALLLCDVEGLQLRNPPTFSIAQKTPSGNCSPEPGVRCANSLS